MSLTLTHVLWVVFTTVVGAVLARMVRRRSRRLRYLKDSVRAWVFGLGLVAVVAYLATTRAPDVAKFGLAGLYIGALYGLFASDPRPRPGGQAAIKDGSKPR